MREKTLYENPSGMARTVAMIRAHATSFVDGPLPAGVKRMRREPLMASDSYWRTGWREYMIE
jgi:hypothetical protein